MAAESKVWSKLIHDMARGAVVVRQRFAATGTPLQEDSKTNGSHGGVAKFGNHAVLSAAAVIAPPKLWPVW